MTSRMFSSDQKAKLTQIINEGMNVLQEVEDLTAGLNDTIKAIAEELRGLAVEHNVPIVSATQTTRSGFGNSDVDLTDTSESFGLPATADFMFALIATEELESSGRIMVKQLKNRYNDPTFHKRFTIGVDRAKMKLYNVDDSDGSELITDQEDETYEYLEDVSSKQSRIDKFSKFVI